MPDDRDYDSYSPGLAPTTPEGGATRPPLSRSSSSLSGLARRGAERVGEDFGESLVLLDVIETFFDSRLDLWERRLKEQSARLRKRAAEIIPRGLRTPGGTTMLLLDSDDEDAPRSGDSAAAASRRVTAKYKADMDREVSRMKVKLAEKVHGLSVSWRSAKTVRTREKLSFFLGVSSLAFTCLAIGMWPKWIPFAYTAQFAAYIPARIYTYKRKAWHYFLFDMCYFVNILDLLWLWVFPGSTELFICCYLLTMGPLASAIITWRNSLVFHSIDKVTSLFIHIYPPIVFCIILFHYEGAAERFPGIASIDKYTWYTKILMAAVPYCIWQGLYFKFISIDRADKIQSGARQNSFQFLLNDKRGAIGRVLRGISADYREQVFIFGQLIYSLIFMLPASVLLLHSSTATNIALITVFAVATWNGANFYVEVFGRKFERELEKLRGEMEAMSAGSGSAGRTPSQPGTPFSPAFMPTDATLDRSPLVLPQPVEHVPDLALDGEKPKTE